jgi:lipopolysaccharide biosynthesis glycosyltransferase
MPSDYINVVYCFDRNYVDPTAVSTYSVFKSSKTRVKFYWICSGYAVLHAEFYRKLLAELGIDITLIEVSDDLFASWKKDLIVPHIPKAAYMRILIPDLVNENRVIYLDSDTIVRADLSELYNIDLGSTPIGGTYNFFEKSESHIRPPILNHDVPYINSGVLVMDLDKLRRDDFSRKAEEIHRVHYDKIMASDQCVINKYLEKNKTLIDRKWNYMAKGSKFTEAEFEHLLVDEDIRVLHFTDCSKPWEVIGRNRAMSRFWWSIANDMRDEIEKTGSEIF